MFYDCIAFATKVLHKLGEFGGEGEGDNFVSSIFLINCLNGRKFKVTKEDVFLHFRRLKMKSDFPRMSC